MCSSDLCVNIHLIRHPAHVMASYGAKRTQMSLEDIGFQQQFDVFQNVGGIILDSADVRNDPHGMLEKLCDTIGLSFDPAMLDWKAGPRVEDGIWAKHWYNAVHQSTGFAGPEGPLSEVSAEHQDIFEKALPLYEELRAKKI